MIDHNEEQRLSTSTCTLSEQNIEFNRNRSVLRQIIHNSEEMSDASNTATSLQEPDVIASTKNIVHQPSSTESNTTSPSFPEEPAPIAPPRRKKKLKAFSQQNSSSFFKSANSSTNTLCKVSTF